MAIEDPLGLLLTGARPPSQAAPSMIGPIPLAATGGHLVKLFREIKAQGQISGEPLPDIEPDGHRNHHRADPHHGAVAFPGPV